MKTRKAIVFVTVIIVANLVPFPGQSGVVFTNLYSFTNGVDGAFPWSLVKGLDGNIYGITDVGGPYRSQDPIGCGAVFRISPVGAVTTFGYLDGTNGDASHNILQGTDGSIYGVAYWGGVGPSPGGGTVFKINGAGMISSLVLFDGTNGGQPSAFAKGVDGNFYGATTFGHGPTTSCTVFRLTTNGIFTNLVLVPVTNTGAGFWLRSLVQETNGDLYGSDYNGGLFGTGRVLKLASDGSLTTFCSFDGTNGSGPYELIQGSDGDLYGTTRWGGMGYIPSNQQSGNGTFFKLTPDGTITTLGFLDGTNGSDPPQLVQGPDGSIYDTASQGGEYGYGSIVQLGADGSFNLLYSFTGGSDGGIPYGGLVLGNDGNFYGVTYYGGSTNEFAKGYGTVFRITIPMAPVLKTIAATNGTFSLTWNAVSGLSYQVQYNPDLTSTNWSDLGGVIVATNATMSVSDAMTPDSQRFYRVVLLP